ncbi:hypothetical protein FW778_01490 [Ginsengibacter hankyongi]|uniref:DUF748 domain-containing protein n=1 Tax=Ginsengibacter hankyongi TaxID=2607284 RepID=A0A5J5IMK4_9BACT|nr:hypothetical protein [Ginsengibacter hankyongi]KAA9040742.1 hypothetical protein FW778_01490 [Ginsengibacter hankyongi]
MHLRNIIKSISRKLLFIILGVILVAVSLYFVWQNNKYRFARDKLKSTVSEQTDSLYKIKYDSLYFDEITGEAYLKNIHIGPDTTIIKRTKLDDLPYILLDITISTLKVNGVKTDKALLGKQMEGDSVIIDHPDVVVYFIKPLQKKTNINEEATSIYNEILGNLKRIQVSRVFINNVHIQGINYFEKGKVFDLTNGNIQLTDVLVDSAHNLDTTRTLFCKQIGLQVASFVEYDNSRPEIRVKNLNYSGADNLLSFGNIDVNRFESSNGDSSKLLRASNLVLKGIDANEFVKNKNIIVDTIQCKDISVYQPPLKKLKMPRDNNQQKKDTTGFRHVYSIEMTHLGFPKISFIPRKKSGISIGNIAVTINEVKADEVIDVQNNPLDYSKEVEITTDNITMNSKDGFYNYTFRNASINSLHKQLKIASVGIKPLLSEKAFANKAHFQKDRYEVDLKDISLKNIDMKNLLDKKIFASDLVVNNISAKIYRDIRKPLSGKNKVGNYPSQMLGKANMPVNISHATLSNAFIQYTEHEKISDSSGVVTFNGTSINISNITNVKDAIERNGVTTISYKTRILNEIPAEGTFKFFLNSNTGSFIATGHVSAFDALSLNKVSVPMALMRLNTGQINAIDFNFTGNDTIAKGDFVMKYNKLKVDVLKRDKDSKEIKKKGLTSLVANIIVKNNNPENGNLRKETPHFDRDVQKSFFNLIWKTIFTGMKKTVGLP